MKWQRKLKYHGVWVIVLLIYTHTVHTAMSFLNCPAITDTSGDTLSVSASEFCVVSTDGG